jgi:hypothetical protein
VDINTNAFRIVSSLTSENKGTGKSESARQAGKIGGKVRASKLSQERRREIAAKAIRARWAKRDAKGNS